MSSAVGVYLETENLVSVQLGAVRGLCLISLNHHPRLLSFGRLPAEKPYHGTSIERD